jgi:hypothetical protein
MTTTQRKEYHGGGGPGGVIRITMMTKAMSDKQNEIDAALPPASRAYGPEGEMGRCLGIKKCRSITMANTESSFHEESFTVPPAKLVRFGN